MGYSLNLLVLVLFLVGARLAYKQISSPLNAIPGPFLARFSNIWRLIDVWLGHSDKTQLALHRKHGDYVRLGPNCITISDPSLIHVIYRTHSPYNKSEFYAAADTTAQGAKKVQSQFSTRDEDFHEYLVRPIKGAYSLSSVLRFEDRVNSTLEYFVRKLRNEYIVDDGAAPYVCPLGQLLHDFAFDVVGEITFSERLGCLDGNKEMKQLMRTNMRGQDYLGIVGQMPGLDPFLKNQFYTFGPTGFAVAADYAAKRLSERVEAGINSSSVHKDFLDLFIAAENDAEISKECSQMTPRQGSWLLINIVAGSDTTATALESAVFHISKNSCIHERLSTELRSAFDEGTVPDFRTCQNLMYLDAIVKETVRFCPSIGLPLERVVPVEGLQLGDGRIIPQGTIVGINPRVISRDKRVFGETADAFIPERWLRGDMETTADFETRLTRMKDATLTFGHGRRSCLGMNVAVMELYKCLAQLFLYFDVSCLLISRTSTAYFRQTGGPGMS